jgi:hypothetical protein
VNFHQQRLKAMRFARLARVNSSQPGVMAKKIGASPSGFTTGSKAPIISRIALANWPKSDQIIGSPLFGGFFQMFAEGAGHDQKWILREIGRS